MRLGRYLTSLTKPELEEYLNDCNFSEEEAEIFKMLSKGKSAIEICDKMGLSESGLYRRIAKIKRKVNKTMVTITQNGIEISAEDVANKRTNAYFDF